MKTFSFCMFLFVAADLSAQPPIDPLIISDAQSNSIRSSWKRLSDGRSEIVWQMISNDGQSSLIHQWSSPFENKIAPWDGTVDKYPDHISNLRKDEVDLGYPGPHLFQLTGNVLDVVVATNGAGDVGMVQFQRNDGQWLWVKWAPLVGYSLNSGTVEGRWLGPGKIELWAPDRGNEHRATIELTGFFDPFHPDIPAALKNGKPYFLADASPSQADVSKTVGSKDNTKSGSDDARLSQQGKSAGSVASSTVPETPLPIERGYITTAIHWIVWVPTAGALLALFFWFIRRAKSK